MRHGSKGRIVLAALRGFVFAVPRCSAADHQTARQQGALRRKSSTIIAGLLRLIKQLQVKADHNLSRGDLMQQETLRNWPLGALVFLDVGHSDLCPTQKI